MSLNELTKVIQIAPQVLYNFSTLVGVKLYYRDEDGNNIENYLIAIKYNISFSQHFG